MAEEKKFSRAEVRRTIASSLTTAFGLVIALLWNTVVTSGLTLAGASPTAPQNPFAWAYYVVTAIVLTVGMVFLIILFSRWGAK